MCGIIGVFAEKSEKSVARALQFMQHRGRDGAKILKLKGGAVGQCLHAMTGKVTQPLQGRGVLVANCEIYNYKDLGTGNDAEVLLQLLDEKGIEQTLPLLDGVYAFAYVTNKEVVLARDYWGVKPLYYATKPFAFASEKKVLQGCEHIRALHPRKLVRYNGTHVIVEDRPEPLKSNGEVAELFEQAVLKRVPEQPFGVMLSGTDSFLIAKVLLKNKIKAKYYTAGMKGCKDISTAQAFAKEHSLQHTVLTVQDTNITKLLPVLCPIIESSQPQEVETALLTYIVSAKARKDGCKALFSGMGADEVFGSYERMREGETTKERLSMLRRIFETSLYAQDCASMAHTVELRLPFLDSSLVHAVLNSHALKQHLAKEFSVTRVRRLSPQYGSGVSTVIQKDKSRTYQEYWSKPVLKIAALLSGGKDSVHALDIMKLMGYEVSCGITIHSKNKDSYLYHTPNTRVVRLQAEAMALPLLEQVTMGKQEDEIEDLRKVLVKAKKEFGIEGVCCGALFSQYQRDRIEGVCENVGLVFFAPLWHKAQLAQMKEVLQKGYEVIMTATAADGLDSSWLGRVLVKKDVERLEKLINVNVAGEGGEFETLVLWAPFFTKELHIVQQEIVEEPNTSRLIVKEVRLRNKQ